MECTGPRIRVTINGTRVQDVDQSTIAEIKDKPLQGYLSLQNHGGRIEFRNPQLKELDTASQHGHCTCAQRIGAGRL